MGKCWKDCEVGQAVRIVEKGLPDPTNLVFMHSGSRAERRMRLAEAGKAICGECPLNEKRPPADI